MLDGLSAPASGAEDTRSQAQRFHDGLQEAMKRMVAAGLLPERAGQPVKAWVHISLADLMVLEGSSARSTPPPGRTWSGSAFSSTGSATTPAPATTALALAAPTATGRARPARIPRGRVKPSSARSSAKPRFFYCTLDPLFTALLIRSLLHS